MALSLCTSVHFSGPTLLQDFSRDKDLGRVLSVCYRSLLESAKISFLLPPFGIGRFLLHLEQGLSFLYLVLYLSFFVFVCVFFTVRPRPLSNSVDWEKVNISPHMYVCLKESK